MARAVVRNEGFQDIQKLTCSLVTGLFLEAPPIDLDTVVTSVVAAKLIPAPTKGYATISFLATSMGVPPSLAVACSTAEATHFVVQDAKVTVIPVGAVQ